VFDPPGTSSYHQRAGVRVISRITIYCISYANGINPHVLRDFPILRPAEPRQGPG
jgi:hypothetical protein